MSKRTLAALTVAAALASFESLDAKGELESAFKQSSSCDKLAG